MIDGSGIAAIFVLGAYVGALVGALAGLVVGWGAGRYARARSTRQAKRDFQRARARHGSWPVVLDNAPRPQPQTRIPDAPPRDKRPPDMPRTGTGQSPRHPTVVHHHHHRVAGEP